MGDDDVEKDNGGDSFILGFQTAVADNWQKLLKFFMFRIAVLALFSGSIIFNMRQKSEDQE